jgi:hypothetical protein
VSSIYPVRCRANTVHIRQSGPDAGLSWPDADLGFQMKVVKTSEVVGALRSETAGLLRVRGRLGRWDPASCAHGALQLNGERALSPEDFVLEGF